MNQKVALNLMSWNPQITSLISIDDELTCVFPLSRPIEFLIDPSIETGGGLSNGAAELQVFKPIFERTPFDQLTIRSNHRQSLPPRVDRSNHGKPS